LFVGSWWFHGPTLTKKKLMDDTMNGGDMPSDTSDSSDTSQAQPNESNPDEPVSVFIPKAALGGEQCKVGDSLTLKVEDIDSETGDLECTVDYKGGDKQDSGSMSEAFDTAMPPDQQT